MWNAKLLGLADDTSNSFDEIFTKFRLGIIRPGEFMSSSEAQVCSKRLNDRDRANPRNDTDCVRNMISNDGMHWCMETIGGRLNAGIACLLGCIYNPVDKSDTSSSTAEDIELCAQSCNDKYMSLTPLL